MLRADLGADSVGPYLELFPTDFDESESFKLVVHRGWRHLEAAFVPGTFSASLVQAMGTAGSDRQSIFKSFAASANLDGGQIVMLVNGSEVSPMDPETWPEAWSRLSISVKKSPTDASLEDLGFAVTWSGRLLGMVLALAPTEEVLDSPYALAGAPEGAAVVVEATKYERSRLNRAACIELRGTTCLVCGFDFAERYGPLGEGFIHVHHLVPVSEIGPNYIINPASDLVPICPNCHSMIHRRNPPLTVEQLRDIIRGFSYSENVNKGQGPSTKTES
jgi:5-methylcytosine-specific restriction protein A